MKKIAPIVVLMLSLVIMLTTSVQSDTEINGSINASSIPSGVDLYDNDVYIGVTPIQYGATPGSHTLSFEKEGYETYVATVDVASGQISYVSITVTLVPYGIINVTSVPSGAKVHVNYIDTYSRYYTPTQLSRKQGDYTVFITKVGYQTFSVPVEVLPGEVTTVNAELQPHDCTINATSVPSGAQLYEKISRYDYNYIGTTPLQYKAAEGNHTLQFRKTGYESYSTTVECVANQITYVTTTCTATLQPVTNGTDANQTPCTDECSLPDEVVCSGNGYKNCGDYDDDPCWEWSAVTDCTEDEICENGACTIPLIEPPEEPQEEEGPCPNENLALVCHMPGTPAQLELCIAPEAVPAHVEQGGYLGPCIGEPPKEEPEEPAIDDDDDDSEDIEVEEPEEEKKEKEKKVKGEDDDVQFSQIVNNVKAQEQVNIPIYRPDTPIQKVTVEVKKEVPKAKITFKSQGKPPVGMPRHKRQVRKYIVIEHPEIDNEDIERSRVEFKLEKAWLERYGAELDDVMLTKFIDGEWKDLITWHIDSDFLYHYFEADAEGLSVFAVTLKGTVARPVSTGTEASPEGMTLKIPKWFTYALIGAVILGLVLPHKKAKRRRG